MLEVKNLHKSFKLSAKQQKIEKCKIKHAVAGVDFVAKEGQILGVLGANGAGKTTTLRMLATLIKPDEGEILYEGEDIKKDVTSYRKNIGFLTSESKLEDFFTPNYLFNYFSNLYGVEEAVRDERREKYFKRFGIDKFAEVKVSELSTGMKQKISLVIAIVHDPKVIIFDEPTNGLDILTEKIVVDFLLELKREGKCIIVSSHIISLIEKICDRVVFIVDGKSVLFDELKNVTLNESLEEAFFGFYKGE